jgi:hypothetical protein
LLASVSRTGLTHTFPLDQATEQLYDVREIDHYAAESEVVFLIRAARENKPVKRTYTKPDGTQGEFVQNGAERSSFIVRFDREGNHRKTIDVDVSFEIQQLGVFPTGDFLAFGYDERDHSPKLAMLKNDGSLLRVLQVPKGDVPESMFGTKDGSDKGDAVYIATAQFVPQGHSILVAQNKTAFPLLKVNEGGAISAIPTKLPKDTQIEGLVPSDLNLFARVSPATDGSIYEISAHDGVVLRRFELRDGRAASGVACVHDGKFLSFEHGEGKLIPLIGTAELAGSAETHSNSAAPTK